MKRTSFITLLALALATAVAVPARAQDNDRGFEVAKNLEIFANVYKNINQYYVDDIEPGKTMKVAIDAMLASLDPYTNYYPESAMEDVKLQLTGEYGGIGALIHQNQRDKKIYIAEPYEGFPAEKAGLKAGDIFVSLDGESTEGKTVANVSEKLRGLAGTSVTVVVERDGKKLTKELRREAVKFSDVPYSGFVKGTEIGYIKLTEFTQDAASHVKAAFQQLKGERPGMKGVILDLRGNGGGLMNEAVDLVNIFVKRGELIVETKGKQRSRNQKSFTSGTPVDTEIPVAVLVDEHSASASEIVSGSLQDLDRAVIIGNRTFGKGLVQNVLPMNYNTQMKVTVAKYYIPSGRCVQAIDYSHRDKDGRPLAVPDSLKTAFKTKNGRTVYDGYGIEPDVEVDLEYMNMLEMTLVGQLFVFDWATQYARDHESIPAAKDFEITDEIFNDFKQYMSRQTYTYNTATERMLAELRKVAKEEEYLDSIDAPLAMLEERLKSDKERDMDKNRATISDLLKSELLTRYYHQKGQIEGMLEGDPCVKKAVEKLSDRAQYNKILNK